jgi:hypothetical protein
VPPKGYKARKDDYKDLDFVVPHPIEQIVGGKDGNFELVLLQRESRALSKYAKLVGCFDKNTEKKKPFEVEKMVSLIVLFCLTYLFFFIISFLIIFKKILITLN